MGKYEEEMANTIIRTKWKQTCEHVINIVSLFLLSSFSFALFVFYFWGCTTGGRIVSDRPP